MYTLCLKGAEGEGKEKDRRRGVEEVGSRAKVELILM